MKPIAYLYHDTKSAETAHPLLYSTLLVLAADRAKHASNETPLFTQAQLDAAVAAERKRCAKLCADLRDLLRGNSYYAEAAIASLLVDKIRATDSNLQPPPA